MTKEIGKFGNSIGNEFNKVGKELGKTLDPKNWKMPDLPPALKLIPGVGLGKEFIKNSVFKNISFQTWSHAFQEHHNFFSFFSV